MSNTNDDIKLKMVCYPLGLAFLGLSIWALVQKGMGNSDPSTPHGASLPEVSSSYSSSSYQHASSHAFSDTQLVAIISMAVMMVVLMSMLAKSMLNQSNSSVGSPLLSSKTSNTNNNRGMELKPTV